MPDRMDNDNCLDQNAIVATFMSLLGESKVLSGDRLALRDPGYCSNSYACGVLLLPENTEDVSRICAKAGQLGLSLVPHGGMTGLVDGTQTSQGQVALSFERINSIKRIDPMQRIAVVDAGVTLQDLITACAEFNLQPGVNLPSRGSCTIGGMAATNAGGIQAIRYGMMRENILGMTVVLASGEILDLSNTLVKNNAGYDLKQLFIGSEGTLGLITQLVLKLHALPVRTETALIACPNATSLLILLEHARNQFGEQLLSFEAMWPEYFKVTSSQPGIDATVLEDTHGIYAILETGQCNELPADVSMLEDFLATAFENQTISDGIVAQSAAQRTLIWRIREDSEVPYTKHRTCLSYDVGLELQDIPIFVERLQGLLEVQYPDLGLYVFGHLGDGNLHLMLGITQDHQPDRSQFDQLVYCLLKEFAGSTISAEHGIGLEKKDYLSFSRTSSVLKNMALLKRSFDPQNILNAGKIFD